MRLLRRHEEEHKEVREELDRHEKQIEGMQQRLRSVEVSVGIYRPRPFRKVNGGAT